MNNKSITPKNNKGQNHGYWEVYFDDDLWYKCLYHNDKEVGYSELYNWNNNGKLRCKQYNI